MKTQFKYLSVIGTALAIATGSTAAFAQSDPSNNLCNYTPENRQCISQGDRDGSRGTSDMMSEPSTSYPNQMDSTSGSRMNQNNDSTQMTNPETRIKDNPVNGPGAVDSNMMSSPSSTNQNVDSTQMTNPETRIKDNPVNGPGSMNSN